MEKIYLVKDIMVDSCMSSAMEFLCDGRCRPRDSIRFCDGYRDCADGADEIGCNNHHHYINPGIIAHPDKIFVPSQDIVTSIVLPTILVCICMVAAMLIGINKCKQWELDKIGEMRRTRRVVQRMTTRLREKNFRTIQRARDLRKRAVLARKQRNAASTSTAAAPPIYDATTSFACSGTSPPPAYEHALLDEFYFECAPTSEQ